MKSTIDCVHCYLKQAISCMKQAGLDEKTQYKLIYELMDYVKTYNIEDSPAVNSTKIYLKTYEIIGNEDPYKEARKQSNDLALRLYPELKKKLEHSRDKLYDALKISVAGNIIDLGIHRSFDVDEALKQSMETGFTKDHYSRFLNKLRDSSQVLFLGDNAGEIVFDRILAEELYGMGKSITYVVKEAPILNDATMEDAEYTGMDKVAKVITNGSNYLGTCLDRVSEEFLELLYSSPVVIAKGQANFEALEDKDVSIDRVFFLLKVKCEEVAKAVGGVQLGDMVFFTR